MKAQNVFLVFGLALMAHFVSGVKVEMTLFANDDYSGQSITINQTHRRFGCATKIIGLGEGFKSYCYSGAWTIAVSNGSLTVYPDTSRRCKKMTAGFEDVISIHQFGPSDTATASITFGRPHENIIIQKNAEAFLNITAEGAYAQLHDIYTTGWSSWTVYEFHNFEGRSSCVSSTREISRHDLIQFGLPTVGSVIKGCTFQRRLKKTEIDNENQVVDVSS